MPEWRKFKVTDKEKQDFFKWLYANGYTPAQDFNPIQHPAFLQWDKLGRPSADVRFTPGKGGTWQAAIQGGGQPATTQPDWYSKAKAVIAGIPQPTPQPAPAAPVTEPSLEWYVPERVLWDRAKNKFYDASGQAEITPADATQMRNAYVRETGQFGQPQQNWQMDYALLQSREAEKERAWSSAQQRFAAKDMGINNLNIELQRQINEMRFERDRERMLSGLPSNDWITRYTLQNQPNPYQKPEVSPIDQLESNLDMATGTVQKWEAEAVNAANAEAAGERYHITSAEATEAANNAQKARDAMYATWKTVQEESVGWSPQPVPQPYPNAPGWLPQYAPGLQAGQMITRQNVPTPSGQQLTAMSQDQLEQLGHFGKWTGQLGGKYPWESLTEAASLMQPRSPGFGRTRWTPPRQV